MMESRQQTLRIDLFFPREAQVRFDSVSFALFRCMALSLLLFAHSAIRLNISAYNTHVYWYTLKLGCQVTCFYRIQLYELLNKKV